MTLNEFQTERTRIISEMLDNPDKYGIYPTTKCFESLDKLFLESQSEVIYPREFVEWYVVNCLVVGDHFCKRTFDYEDLKQWNTLEEVFEYWQSKVKNEKR